MHANEEPYFSINDHKASDLYFVSDYHETDSRPKSKVPVHAHNVYGRMKV